MMRPLVALLALAIPLGAQNMSETPRGRDFPFTVRIELLREAGLSDSQLQQIAGIFMTNRQSLSDLRAELEKREAYFQTLMDADTIDVALAEAAVERILDGRTRLAKMQTMMTLQMRLILTNTQWHKLADLQRKAIAATSPERPPYANNEASALASIRNYNTAEAYFANKYKKGYTDGLNRLGEPPSGVEANEHRANLLAGFLSGLAEGGSNFSVTRNGYRFTYTPGPGGYGEIKAYTIIGQPLEYGVSGKRSFYTDQTGIIRWTTDNRPATANDAAI